MEIKELDNDSLQITHAQCPLGTFSQAPRGDCLHSPGAFLSYLYKTLLLPLSHLVLPHWVEGKSKDSHIHLIDTQTEAQEH